MKITIITLFPKMVEGFFAESIIARAVEKQTVEIEILNLRDFADPEDPHKQVDDRPYGGGAGMLLMAEPIAKSVSFAKASGSKNSHVVLTSAKGKVYNQVKAQELSKLDHLVIFAAHYEGVDERAMHYFDEEISLGDFVLTGGEIAAAAIVDSIVRLLPGVLKKDDATTEESFMEVEIAQLEKALQGTQRHAEFISASETKKMQILNQVQDDILVELKQKGITKIKLLEYPHYTRPSEFEGEKIPEILLSGDPKKIRAWRLVWAFSQTLRKRPDLL